MVSLKDFSYSNLGINVLWSGKGLDFYLEIPFKLILAADINYQYLIDYICEQEYTSFTLLFPLRFLYNMGRYPY